MNPRFRSYPSAVTCEMKDSNPRRLQGVRKDKKPPANPIPNRLMSIVFQLTEAINEEKIAWIVDSLWAPTYRLTSFPFLSHTTSVGIE